MLDLRIEDAVVVTMDPDRPTAHTIGIWNGRVVGVDDEVDDLPARRVQGLDGACVLPGLVDAHTHLAWAGQRSRSLDLSDLRRLHEVLAVVDRGARSGPDERWLDVQGYLATADIGLTAAHLDTVTGARPTYVVDTSGHAAVLNSAALDRMRTAGLDPEALGVGRDHEGRLDGVLVEGAHTAFRQQVRLPYALDDLVDWIEAGARTCRSQGVTTCAEAGIAGGMAGNSPIELMAYQRAVEAGRLPVRVQTMVGDSAVHPVAAAAEDRVTLGLDLGLCPGYGDDRLWLGPMKIWLDGGMQARTAALTEPFVGTSSRGQLAGEPEELIARIVAAHRSGWQLALHAIGDRAVDLAIEAVERAQRECPRPDARHRIEHCGLVRPDQLDALARVGLIAVVQPEFMLHQGSAYAAALGETRGHWQYRGRSLLDAGVPLVGSSDRPVVSGSPLAAMSFMMTRTDRHGLVVGPGEEIGIDDALRSYTVTAAHALGKAGLLGRVGSGALADLTVLDDDPRAVPPARVEHLAVLDTMLAGQWSDAERATAPAGRDRP